MIDGRLVNTVGNKPISAGRKKTGAYVDGSRKFDARFCVEGFREFAGSNESEPTVQLQIVRMFLAVISTESGILE